MGYSRKKPICLGRGWTPVYVTVCLSNKAWKRALKGRGEGAPDFPAHMHASCTHFPGEGDLAPLSIITIGPEYQRTAEAENILNLLAHEAVHVKQRAEEIMGTTFDHETEAYFVQGVAWAAWQRVRKALKTEG
jgi:hypothetical protein